MTELLTHFKKQYDTQSHHDCDWIKDEQEKAFRQFASLGLPTRKTENWKYTSIDLLKHMQFDGEPQEADGHKNVLLIQDGQLILPDALSEGVEALPLFTALKTDRTLLSQPQNKEPFAHLNLALLEGGLVIRVKKNVQLDNPIEVMVRHSDSAMAHHLQMIYVLEEGAKASIIETYQSDAVVPYFHNMRVSVLVKDSANCCYYRILNEAQQAVHFAEIQANLSQHAFFESHAYSFGGALSRTTMAVDLKAPEASCTLNGLYVLGDKQHIATYTSQHHETPHAFSEETYKGIVGGAGTAVFNGNIRVEKGAQKTNASLQNKNILLSKNATVDTKPQLEIFADDVKCAHGTTVGQLDDKALFYLRSRGIPLNAARELLVHAFAGDLLEKIDNDVLKTTLLNHLNDKLRKVA